MSQEPQTFRQPMQPWAALQDFGRKIRLKKAGLELFCFDSGETSKPAALLIHGLGDEADTWRHLFPPLSARWRLLAPDLPGFGRSDKPDVKYDPDFLTAILFEFLQQLEIEKAVLIGHSLGGMLAHRMALERTDVGRSLVLISGSMLLKPRHFSPQILLFLLPGIGEWLYTRLRKDPQAAYDTLRLYCADFDSLPEGDRRFLYTRVNQRVWSDDQRRAYFSVLRNCSWSAGREQKDLKQKLTGFQTPTLILWGEQDQVFDPENGRAVAEMQPNARLIVFPNLGHNSQQEDPKALAEAILADERL